MRVVVSGSRTITDEKTVEGILRPYLACKDTVITGGCPTGVDPIAEDYAHRYFMHGEIHKAKWKEHGPAAGPIRNRMMLEDADQLVAIWDGKSRGTKNAIETALKLGVETHVHFVRPQ